MSSSMYLILRWFSVSPGPSMQSSSSSSSPSMGASHQMATKGTDLQQVRRKDRKKGILQKGTDLQQVRRKKGPRHSKWNAFRVDQHQRRICMAHYEKPSLLFNKDVLDLKEYENHFESLNQGELCASIVFFLSVLFSVIHAWKPDRSFKNYCPEHTSPARALCFLNRLRLTEGEMKGWERSLQQDVAYGALTAINHREESKKNVPADPADSLKEKNKKNPNRRPVEELLPIMHCVFKKMLFKFVTQQWSSVLRDDKWNGWEEFKEYFGQMHHSGICWGWKKRDLQYRAWDELLDFVLTDQCCKDLRAKQYSPEEFDKAQGRLSAYMSNAEEPQTQSSSRKSAPISTEPPGSASNEAAREETPPDAETTVINQAHADLLL